MFFVAGNTARLGSLGVGFCLILSAAFLRSKGNSFRHAPFIIVTGAYFLALTMLTRFQEHAIWQHQNQQIFVIVCIFLFIIIIIMS